MVNKALGLALDVIAFVIGLVILVACVTSISKMIDTVTPETEYMGNYWDYEAYATPTPTPTPTVGP